MVKIKDFTLESKKLGGGARAPRALHTSRPCLSPPSLNKPKWRAASDLNLLGGGLKHPKP